MIIAGLTVCEFSPILIKDNRTAMTGTSTVITSTRERLPLAESKRGTGLPENHP
jgi:hypothetical protein